MKKSIIFLLCMVILVIQSQAQDIQEFQCLYDDQELYLSPTDGDANSINGYYLTPRGTLRVLVIFAQINYNQNPNNDPGSSNWDQNEFPDWKDELFDPYWSGNLQGKITRYYGECSFGEYKLLGDYLASLITINESSYGGWDPYGDLAANQVIITANSLGSLATQNGFDILDFDMWQNAIEVGTIKVNQPDNPNSYDHIMVIFRNHNYLLGGKGSVDAGSYNLYGYGSDTRSRFGGAYGLPFNILHHEYDHMLFGDNSFHAGGGRGGTTAYLMNLQSGWSMMGGGSSSLLTCNGWDRDRLGYKHPNKTMTISALDEYGLNEVNTDLDPSSIVGTHYYILRDYVTYGDVIRIKLPNIPVDNYPQWLWIENHRTITNNNSEFDQFQYQSAECVEEATPGLYPYIQIAKDIKEGPTTFSGNQEYLRFFNAGGFYDILHTDTTVQNTCLNNANEYPFKIDSTRGNPLTGSYVQEKTSYDMDDNDYITGTEGKLNVIEDVEGQLEFHYPFLGESSIAFTLNGKNRLSIGTNPSTSNMLTFTGNNSVSNDLRSNYLNNLLIEIVDEDNGNLKVKVQFNNVDVTEDVRWCGEEVFLPPVIEGNDYSLNITNGSNVLIDWGENATRRANPQTINGIPRFNDPSILRCIDNSYLHLDENSTLELDNQSTVILEDGCTLEIKDGSLFKVTNGSSFVLLNGSLLKAHGSGEIIIENNSYFCIEAGAQIELLDEESRIILKDGWINGVNPNVVIDPTPDCEDICNIIISGNGEIIDESITTFYIDQVIDQTTTWNSEQYNFIGDLIIENGGVLNLQSSELGFSKYSRIIIERGGVLNIDGSTISGLLPCSNTMWKGIEVWGTTAYNQSTSGAQGKVIIENGGVIENAETAVILGKTNGQSYVTSFAGGIIQTNEAHFINNETGVRFTPYRNIVSSQEVDNLSYFQITEFLTDAELANDSLPDEFIHLDSVYGISIQGCSFINSRDQEEINLRSRGIGILSEDANFTVTDFCPEGYPCEEPVRSYFRELNYGVKAFDDISTKTFEINRTNFYNNLTGIYFKNIDEATIIFDSIQVRNYYLIHQQDDIYGGIYVDHCTGYTIEENYIYNDNPYDPHDEIRSIGITVNNSGDNYNMIFRNTFDYLQMAILAQNENRGTTNGTGLKLKCNVCTHNEGDFAVTGDGSSLNEGISSWQGSNTLNDPSSPAGNLFTHAGNNDPYSDFNNTISRSWIIYFHHNGTDQDLWVPKYYQYITPYNTSYAWDYDEVCISNYQIGGGHKKSTQIVMDQIELKSRMICMETLRDSVIYNLDLWIDAGNTQELNDEVESSTPPEALEIYDELISDSPYLSDSVLSTSIGKEDVLVNSMIRDIMIANPHGIKKDDLLAALEQRVPPVPEYMMSEIMAGLDSISVKEELESEIAWYQQERDRAFNMLLKLYLTDTTISSSEDSIVSLISNYGNLQRRYYLVRRYMEIGDTSNAFTVLSNLANQFVMDSTQQSQHLDYVTIFEILRDLKRQGKSLDSLSVSSRQALHQIANHNSKVAAMAQNIIRRIDGTEYPEAYILPTSGLNLRNLYASYSNDLITNKHGVDFNIYPNPCSDYFVIEYSFNQPHSNTTYSVTDQLGRIITEGQIVNLQDQLIIRTSSYSSGLHTVKFLINGKIEEVIKLNVIK